MTTAGRLEQPPRRAARAQPARTQDLWPVDDLVSWRDAPMDTLRSWLAQQRITGTRAFRASSCDTYAAMFSRWLQHLEPRHLNVLEATAADATAFFGSLELEPISRRRYLQLLDRVYAHLARCGRSGENPLQCELSKERELERGAPPCLDADQQHGLIEHLGAIPGWKGTRDRALAALLLGAGLRANEGARLPLAHVAPDFQVKVCPDTVHRPHDTLVVPDGPWRRWYVEWLQVRQERAIPGEVAAPATLKGRAFDPSGVFRRVHSWLDGAGVESEQSGPNVLRATFARNALTCGRYTLEQVSEYLGHEDSRATARYLPDEMRGFELRSSASQIAL